MSPLRILEGFSLGEIKKKKKKKKGGDLASVLKMHKTFTTK